jgi:hypothetical protein
METWKPVLGYEGLYEVSSIGRVRSLDHEVRNRYSTRIRKGRIRKLTPDRAGYMMVSLSRENSVRTGKVHRLVAEAFIGPAPTKDANVNHKDFAKDHNSVENLEWCTGDENLRHAVLAGRFDGAVRPKRGKKLNVQKVREIKAANAAGEAPKSIATRFAVAHQTVTRIINGNIWSRA